MEPGKSTQLREHFIGGAARYAWTEFKTTILPLLLLAGVLAVFVVEHRREVADYQAREQTMQQRLDVLTNRLQVLNSRLEDGALVRPLPPVPNP